MSFHNGVPISVVSSVLMPTNADSSSRRRAEQDARIEAGDVSELHRKGGRRG
jgi:hypothetical protein